MTPTHTPDSSAHSSGNGARGFGTYGGTVPTNAALNPALVIVASDAGSFTSLRSSIGSHDRDVTAPVSTIGIFSGAAG